MLGEAQQAKSLGHVECIAHRRLPGNVFTVGQRSLAAEKIDSKSFARRRGRFAQSGPGNLHSAVPNFSFLIDTRCNLKAGVPNPAFFVMRFREVDVKVYPFALWRYLEFFIASNILEVRAYEDFCYIPIPKFIGLSCGAGIRLQKKFLIGTNKQEI